jgi:hypothetical protein
VATELTLVLDDVVVLTDVDDEVLEEVVAPPAPVGSADSSSEHPTQLAAIRRERLRPTIDLRVMRAP